MHTATSQGPAVYGTKKWLLGARSNNRHSQRGPCQLKDIFVFGGQIWSVDREPCILSGGSRSPLESPNPRRTSAWGPFCFPRKGYGKHQSRWHRYSGGRGSVSPVEIRYLRDAGGGEYLVR
ncbi:hypothetical protein BSKO_11595 [Bryopsis sp. KO-2023]|nr:hypothetical protein BSKO_11595 [Bryopsis sp. KO-2023]